MFTTIISTIALLSVSSVFVFKGYKNFKASKAAKAEKLRKISILEKYFDLLNPKKSLTLAETFFIHKTLINSDVVPVNCGPGAMFRVSDIKNLTANDVYLGGIYGVWTHNLTYWASCTDKEAKDIVSRQYQAFLFVNIEATLNKLLKK